jgi:SAM-dependent methyltransferase
VSDDIADVRSNVRAFRSERFAYWRCRHCRSIHACDEVDLSAYYLKYPFHSLPDDGRTRFMYERQVGRLRDAGVGRDQSLLDFGCGGGEFVRHLRRRGFAKVAGYDEYSDACSDRSLLGRRYDCVFSQDVLEHVADPHRLLEQFEDLVRPGGLIVLGTPNAEAIDLHRPEAYVHTLHAPYHRHILSKSALLQIGARRGWRLKRYYPTQYANTWLPFLNARFYLYYMRLFDDSLDALIERPRLGRILARLPVALFWGFLGRLFPEETDVMAIFRRP